jgi:hypothetical protein
MMTDSFQKRRKIPPGDLLPPAVAGQPPHRAGGVRLTAGHGRSEYGGERWTRE